MSPMLHDRLPADDLTIANGKDEIHKGWLVSNFGCDNSYDSEIKVKMFHLSIILAYMNSPVCVVHPMLRMGHMTSLHLAVTLELLEKFVLMERTKETYNGHTPSRN